MNTSIHVEMCVSKCMSYLLLCHKSSQTLNKIYYVCFLQVRSLGSLAGSCFRVSLGCNQSQMARSILIWSLNLKKICFLTHRSWQNLFPCSCETKSFSVQLAVAASHPQLPEAAYIFLSCGPSVGQFATWQLFPSVPGEEDIKSASKGSLSYCGIIMGVMSHQLCHVALFRSNAQFPSTLRGRECTQRLEGQEVRVHCGPPSICPLYVSVNR